MGPIFVRKSFKKGPILGKLRKILKIYYFWGEKPLRIGPNFWKQSNQLFFEGEKSSDREVLGKAGFVSYLIVGEILLVVWMIEANVCSNSRCC